MSMSNLTYLVQRQGKNCLCVCHNDHQLFGIGYHFKIFRSQVATGKKLILHPENINQSAGNISKDNSNTHTHKKRKLLNIITI